MIVLGRYDLRERIGKGGMGDVYKAYDKNVKTFVAFKTVSGVPDPEAVKLFRKECTVLSALDHPNIVNITDVGEFKQDGVKKPFLVMPLLSGMPLSKFIADLGRSQTLSLEDAVDIFEHVCRALQAAHDKGVIHRDIKPSNIFIMDDKSVKVIDFGVAHMLDSRTTAAQRGSLLYMSPEQIQYMPLTPSSDIFSLGVVCYETLTRHHPFEGATAEEVRDAILHRIPPPASDFNANVSLVLSQVIHKALAKRPQYRFASAEEFRAMLLKAYRNEPIPVFDPVRIRRRMERARRAFEEGDFQYASELVEELEAEGHLDPEISNLRAEVNRAQRQKRIEQLLEEARARFEEHENPLAIQKVQEILDIDPENAYALGLKNRIAERDIDQSVEHWLKLASDHVANCAYKPALQALREVMKYRPRDERALKLLTEVNRKEQEYVKRRDEKRKAYEEAQSAWQNGEISTAVSKMERVIALDREAPDSTPPGAAARYQAFYNQVRSEHELLNNAYAEASQHLEAGRFLKARQVCDEFLPKYPNYHPLQMLRFNIEDRERQALSRFIAEADRRVDSEQDLEKRVAILREAADHYPEEGHFKGALRSAEQQRDLVHGIVAKAKILATRGQLAESRVQWESLRTIYPQYPGLAVEIEKLDEQRDRQRHVQERTRWIEQVEAQLESGDYGGSLGTINRAQSEFPGEPELAELEQRAQQGIERASQIEELRSSGKHLLTLGDYEAGLKNLRNAYRLDRRNRVTITALTEALTERATFLMNKDWRSARAFLEEVLEIDPANAVAKNLMPLLADAEPRETLEHRQAERQRDLEELTQIGQDWDEWASRPEQVSRRAQAIEKRYPGDQEISEKATDIRRRLHTAVSTTGEGRRSEGMGDESGEGQPAAGYHPRITDSMLVALRAFGNGINASVDRVRRWAISLRGIEPEDRLARRSRLPLYLGALSMCVLAAIIVGFLLLRRRKSSQSPLQEPGAHEVLIQTFPAAADVQIDGRDYGPSPAKARVGQGNHQLKVSKEGYAELQESLSIGNDTQPSLGPFTLQLIPANLWVVSDSNGGEVRVDHGARQHFEGVQFMAGLLSPGTHAVEVRDKIGDATVQLDVEPGSMPIVSTPVQAKRGQAVVVSNFAGYLSIFPTASSLQASLDDKPVGQLSVTGVAQNGLPPGTHTLEITQDGQTLLRRTFETGSTPAVTMFLFSGQSMGSLTVQTPGVNGADVLVDDKLRGQTEDGQLTVVLRAGQHDVQVRKDGYQAAATQSVNLQIGQPLTAKFVLSATPHVASLSLKQVPPEAQVLLDGLRIGSVRADGTFNYAQVPPGDHTVRIQTGTYNAKTLSRQFVADKAVQLNGADFALEPMQGLLTVLTSPHTDNVFVSPAGKTGHAQPRKVLRQGIGLPPGRYLVEAVWPSGRKKETKPVQVYPGKPLSIALQLDTVDEKTDWGNHWDVPGCWKRVSQWDQCTPPKDNGRSVVLFTGAPTIGEFFFAIKLGRERVGWVFNYLDKRHYVSFQMDDKYLYVRSIGGKKYRTKIPYTASGKERPLLEVRVTASSIQHRFYYGGKPDPLFVWRGPVKGKFGFWIPRGGTIEIANFQFRPD